MGKWDALGGRPHPWPPRQVAAIVHSRGRALAAFSKYYPTAFFQPADKWASSAGIELALFQRFL